MKALKVHWVLLLALSTGCSVVWHHRVRADYDQVDRTRTKRLVVVTQPLPEGQQKVGDLLSLVARRYVNQKRNFIAKRNLAEEGPFELGRHCGDGVEGVLHLAPDFRRSASGVEARVQAQLLRCHDGQAVWAAEAAGSFPSEDGRLTEITAQYASELGPEVAPYVAPSFNLLRPTLDTLPDPVLTDEEIGEKIEFGE